MSVEVISSTTTPNGLLEGPHWDPVNQELYYVEIYSNKVHRYSPANDTVTTVDVGEFVGSVVLTKSRRTIIAGKRHFAYLDWTTGALNRIAEIDTEKPDNRFNDGKCDPAGRFWAGTMGPEIDGVVTPTQGSLYCLQTDRSVTKHLENIDISNGLVWSQDKKIMYYIDSGKLTLDAFDYDESTGTISNRRLVFKISEELDGALDGMTMDETGMLWIACYGASKIIRCDPKTGKRLQEIQFPATNITSCCFGGPNYDILYVTCSSFGLKGSQPLAGSIFTVKGLGVKGLPADLYNDD